MTKASISVGKERSFSRFAGKNFFLPSIGFPLGYLSHQAKISLPFLFSKLSYLTLVLYF